LCNAKEGALYYEQKENGLGIIFLDERFTRASDSAINYDMSTQELIIKELEQLPEPLQHEVYDFARFLREKSGDELFDGLWLSESALRKDWETPEEDAAWANL
jgi:hypothetical protein